MVMVMTMRFGKPATLAAIALLLAVAPLRLDPSSPTLLLQEAAAKNGNNGKGGNNGNNGDNGNNGNNGNSGNNGRGAGQNRAGKAKAADSVVDKKITRDSVQIRYRNGYREQVTSGRFIMKDAKGRTIINRRATPVDRVRLWLKQAVP